MIIQDFKKAFKNCDIIAAPTMSVLPPKFSDIAKLSPVQQYQMDILTIPANLSGIPMISLPVKQKEPIGLHLLGDHLQEDKILRIADAYERECK